MPRAGPRFWEIDALRGIAVLLMILSNGLYDAVIFRNAAIDVYSGFWLFLARATAITFMALLGISLTLRAHRHPNRLGRAVLKRGAVLFGLGLIITAITFAAFGNRAIIFGVLHFAGVATVLSYPFIKRPRLALVLAAPVILAGLWLSVRTFAFPWLLPLGFASVGYAAFDYFALLPWLGVVFAGIFAGAALYPKGVRAFSFTEPAAGRGLAWLGRHSLLIYFIHQPILVALLLL